MIHAALLTILLLALTWLHGRVGGGYVWDALNALGFAALAGFAALNLDGLRSTAATGSRLRERLTRHAHLGYVALALVAAHAVGLVVYDPTLLLYLEPGAPHYMWAGVAATVLAIGVVWTAQLPRRLHLHGSARRFRQVHRALAGVLVGLTLWHVVGSGFYLDHWLTKGAAAALCTVCVFWPRPVANALDRIVAPDRFAARILAQPLAAPRVGIPAVQLRLCGAMLLVIAIATVARNA